MEILPRFVIEDDDLELLGQFTAWIENVVVNAGIDYYRRQRYRARESPMDELTQDTFSYEDPMLASGTEFEFAEDKLSEAFGTLNLLRRQILSIVFVEGLSAQETADRLNCSVDYVYLQKHRALKALRNYLMEGGDGHGE